MLRGQQKMVPDKPHWLKKRLQIDSSARKVEHELISNRLHTICQEACCPNQGECFSRGVATFLIMGNICTRNCSFCAVKSGRPDHLDPDEPLRLAHELNELDLRFVVVTSVTRDDLPDGGAIHFANTIRMIKEKCSGVGIEVLVPDFEGSRSALGCIISEAPEVLNHNVETVPRLYPLVRPKADYERSLRLLEMGKKMKDSLITKSGLMVGLGETENEVKQVMLGLRDADCDVLTIGQYLCPSPLHYPVAEYLRPEIFNEYAKIALSIGFKAVASFPFARSSYAAEEFYKRAIEASSRQSQTVVDTHEGNRLC